MQKGFIGGGAMQINRIQNISESCCKSQKINSVNSIPPKTIIEKCIELGSVFYEQNKFLVPEQIEIKKHGGQNVT